MSAYEKLCELAEQGKVVDSEFRPLYKDATFAFSAKVSGPDQSYFTVKVSDPSSPNRLATIRFSPEGRDGRVIEATGADTIGWRLKVKAKLYEVVGDTTMLPDYSTWQPTNSDIPSTGWGMSEDDE